MRTRGWLTDDEALETGRGIPDVRIDVTDFAQVKYEALGQHVSQKGIVDVEESVKSDLTPSGIFEEFITVLDNTE